ncbi:hypothetical protein CROQUDRAFT_656401 [Cronartium quercuum f. sp. fusiforme G11]|uniref:WD40 repeat-like protein n=1 Tax=Cronartium quercuum f. sp. fusiforme G11 TaxID=708437 RepID=A0A9P6TC93_9BASI|nr:hypothetical protein CROQUDRAFT_656401 [Cronartium quercuum f. sp. fusiforme G11]
MSSTHRQHSPEQDSTDELNSPSSFITPLSNQGSPSQTESESPPVIVDFLYNNQDLEMWNEGEEEEEEEDLDEEIFDEEIDTDYSDTPDLINGPTRFYPEVKQPVSDGVNLERSGHYNKPPEHYLTEKRRLKDHSENLLNILATAEGSYLPFDKCKLGQIHVPNSNGTEVAAYGSRIYSGQYSDDGSFFYTCAQAFRIYIYDMTVPPRLTDKNVSDTFLNFRAHSSRYLSSHQDMQSTHTSSLKLIRTFQAPIQNCRWTITDCNLSPDNNWMAYSSITPIVHLVKSRGENEVLGLGLEDHEQEVLDFSGHPYMGRNFGIWSLSFSRDGKELIAGGSNGRILAYDVERKVSLLNVTGHTDDTNAVCFADKFDPNILVSGSDDTYIKVWDRRSLQDAKPAGVLIGHTEGLTYVSAKGDGRYIVSNGKDQGAKLWDLRRMVSDDTFGEIEPLDVSIPGWDYRHGVYEKPKYKKHPQDCSVMTYRGHSVLQTLIRVHFSPPNITGHRYIASGSSDGNIHIWNLDGTIAQVINRTKAVPLVKSNETKSSGLLRHYNDPFEIPSRINSNEEGIRTSIYRHIFYGYDDSMTVRDISWNPNEPSLISTAWGGNNGATGSLALHPFMSFEKRAST